LYPEGRSLVKQLADLDVTRILPLPFRINEVIDSSAGCEPLGLAALFRLSLNLRQRRMASGG
jgi:hypothetical protein